MQFRFSKYRLVLGTVFLSLVGTLAYTQTEVRIRELTEVEADGISSDGAVWFGIDKTDVPASRKISLAELKKTGVQVVNVKQYGADPTGVANATTEIQAAIDAATAVDGTVVATGTFKITGTLYITCHFDGTDATFNCTGTNANSIIVQANKTANTTTAMSGKTIRLPAVVNTTKPGTGWAGQGTGILCRNLDNCRVSVPQASHFGIGLYVSAYGNGTSYTEFNLGRLTFNDINLKVKPDNAAGWVNQNTFLNGRLGGDEASSPFVDLAPYGFGNSTDFNPPNTNTFIGLSVEGEGDATGPEYHLQIAGLFNTFIGTRLEVSSGTPKVNYVGDTVVANLTGRNLFVGGYSAGATVWTYENQIATGNNVIGLASEPDRRSSSNPWLVNAPGGNDFLRMFRSTKDMSGVTTSDTEWVLKYSEDGFETKPHNSSTSRIRMDRAELYIGEGSGTAITSEPYITRGTPASGRSIGFSDAIEMREMTAPGAPPANRVTIYAVDNGAGKTRLMALFPSGVAQQIAIEP